MVNYTLGDGFKKMMEFEVKHTTGDICISGTLDFETRNSYEFPIIATDQGNVNKIATKNFFLCPSVQWNKWYRKLIKTVDSNVNFISS